LVILSRVDLSLFEWFDSSGLNESVWKSSEKEKFENLLDILNRTIRKNINK
jgi:hypothetical protein